MNGGLATASVRQPVTMSERRVQAPALVLAQRLVVVYEAAVAACSDSPGASTLRQWELQSSRAPTAVSVWH